MAERKLTSNLWEYFDRDKIKRTGKCKICGGNFSYKTTIHNLKTHLRRKHPETFIELEMINQTGSKIKIKSRSKPTIVFLPTTREGQAQLAAAALKEKADEDHISDNDHEQIGTPEVSSDSDGFQYPEFLKRHSVPSAKRQLRIDRTKRSSKDEDGDLLRVIADNLKASKSKNTTFAQYIGEQLDHMRPDVASICKKIINEAIYDADVGNLNQFSRITNDPPIYTINTVNQDGIARSEQNDKINQADLEAQMNVICN